MSDKETPFSLFSSSKKKKTDAAPQVSTIAKAPAQPVFDQETQAIFDQINKMQAVILAKLENITRKSGFSKEEVLKLVQGTGNTRPELEKMNAELKAFTAKVSNALGDGILPKTEPSIKQTATTKDRKVKTLGARRQWLKMP